LTPSTDVVAYATFACLVELTTRLPEGKPMADTSIPGEESEAHARREFLKKIGKAGAMVPAISLLLAANFKPAAAQVPGDGNPYGTGGGGCGCGGGGNPFP